MHGLSVFVFSESQRFEGPHSTSVPRGEQAANADEARRMERVACETGRVCMEAVHCRYHAVAEECVRLMREGELGRVRRLACARCARLLQTIYHAI